MPAACSAAWIFATRSVAAAVGVGAVGSGSAARRGDRQPKGKRPSTSPTNRARTGRGSFIVVGVKRSQWHRAWRRKLCQRRFPACRRFRRSQPSSKSAPMPKRSDLKSILIIGAGPIVIGQACEFDYSGTQACKALREEGYKVILVNSNPATIMTDPEFADVTYIEPITWQVVERIIAKEKPDAILPTMGGQTALNCALDLFNNGVLAKYNVELIGASPEAIDKAEDRLKFKNAMTKIGLS